VGCGTPGRGTPALRGLDATVVGTGKRFTSALPQVEGYRSDYYRSTAQGADAAVSLQGLREDHHHQELVPAKALTAAPVKDAKLDEALAKECLATLSYAEHTLVALARTLPREAMTEAQETFFLSLQCSLSHSAALAAKSAGNAVLRRRDLLIEQMKRLSSHLKGSLRTAPLSGTYLFHDRSRIRWRRSKGLTPLPSSGPCEVLDLVQTHSQEEAGQGPERLP
jgi:hypothetical protein